MAYCSYRSYSCIQDKDVSERGKSFKDSIIRPFVAEKQNNPYNLFTRRMQSLRCYSCLLRLVLDHLLINHGSKERKLHQVIYYSPRTICYIADQSTLITKFYTEISSLVFSLYWYSCLIVIKNLIVVQKM